MITELTPKEVLGYCRSFLGLEAESPSVDEVLLAGLLRRAVGILGPCSRVALRAAVLESLSCLHADDSALADVLDDLIEALIVVGDLLELSDVATDDPDATGTWLFAAPPSFVARRSGSVFLVGMAPDQDRLLPEHLDQRVLYSRATRSVLPLQDEDLAEQLTSFGLNQLPEAVWLRAPKVIGPEQLIERYERLLAEQLTSAPIAGLEILDHLTKVTYYRGRWAPPRDQTGTYVARRPQEFGAPLWSVVELADGKLKRLIDLPPRHFRWRGCDAAWHLQMAIDHCARQPQQYRRTVTDAGIRFDFFSPLPLWAQRRLMIFGHERPRNRSLIAYELPIEEVEQEENFLKESLWLEPVDE